MSTPFGLRDLELLVSIHRAGSLKAAAQRMQCTPSALSHRIHELEARVGEQLVKRQGALTLTLAGQRLIPRAEEILTLTAQLAHDLHGLKTARTLGVSSLLLTGPYLAALTDIVQIPAAPVHILSGRSRMVEEWVIKGEADIGLVRVERVRPELRYHILEEDRLAAVARNWVTPSALAGQRWVLFSTQMGHGQAVNRALADAGLAIRAQVVVDHFAAALALLDSGFVTVLPQSVFELLVNAGRLVEIPVPEVIWPTRSNAAVTGQASLDWTRVVIKTLKARIAASRMEKRS
jgi:DNA-binding transcriptional LysR family regulator